MLQCNKYSRSDTGRISLVHDSSNPISAIEAFDLHKPCTQQLVEEQTNLCLSLFDVCIDSASPLKATVCEAIVCKPFHGLNGYLIQKPPSSIWAVVIASLMLLYLIVLLVQGVGRHKKVKA